MSWDVSDFRSLAADLSAAGTKARPLASVVVRKTAADIEADAKEAAPYDTGFLQSSISSTVQETGTAIEADIGPTANYGIYQELGTSVMPPHPYLFPALDRHAAGFEAAMAQVIDRSLR